MDKKQEVDLMPGKDWQSDAPTPGAPFFGSGALSGLAWFLGFCTTAFVVRYFMG